MKKTLLTVISGLCCALLLLNPAYAASNHHSKNNHLTVVYTGNLDGELEPCGCSLEGDFGGIRRQATLVDRLRKKKAAPVSAFVRRLSARRIGARPAHG